jgi:hypothetical protein
MADRDTDLNKDLSPYSQAAVRIRDGGLWAPRAADGAQHDWNAQQLNRAAHNNSAFSINTNSQQTSPRQGSPEPQPAPMAHTLPAVYYCTACGESHIVGTGCQYPADRSSFLPSIANASAAVPRTVPPIGSLPVIRPVPVRPATSMINQTQTPRLNLATVAPSFSAATAFQPPTRRQRAGIENGRSVRLPPLPDSDAADTAVDATHASSVRLLCKRHRCCYSNKSVNR